MTDYAKMTEPELRQKAAEVLLPKPWKHVEINGVCQKCHAQGKDAGGICGGQGLEYIYKFDVPCSAPDPDTRPLPVIVSDLLKLTGKMRLASLVGKGWPESYIPDREFIFADPMDQIRVLLAAAEGEKQ